MNQTLRASARAAWPEHLNRYAWSHFATLTTAQPMTASAVRRAFLNVTVRDLARATKEPVPYFFVIEDSYQGDDAERGHPHVHTLLGGTSRLTVREIAHRWPYGHTRVVRYKPERGAPHYLSKTLDLPIAEDRYDLSRRMPPPACRLDTPSHPRQDSPMRVTNSRSRPAAASFCRVPPMRTEVVSSVESLDLSTWVRSYVTQVMSLRDQRHRGAA